MKHLGREIYKIIEDKRLVKRRIAEQIGMSPAHFSQLMNKETFDPKTLEKIAFAIGVSPGYFFDDWTGAPNCIRDINNGTVIGDATVNVGSNAAYYEKLLAEKERMIKVLLKQLGLNESIDDV